MTTFEKSEIPPLVQSILCFENRLSTVMTIDARTGAHFKANHPVGQTMFCINISSAYRIVEEDVINYIQQLFILT